MGKKTSCNIRDVAQYAGVAPGTVSRVLNNRMGRMTVTAETRARILEGVRVLNYMPNIHAKRLFSHRAGVIALVLPEAIRSADFRLDMHIFGTICGIEEELSPGDCRLQLITDTERFRSRREYLSLFRENSVDGMLVWGALPQSGYWQEAEKKKYPVLFLATRPTDCAGSTLLGHDYGPAARRLTELLLAAGHRRLLQVGGPADSEIATSSRSGIRAALTAYSDARLHVLPSNYSAQEALAAFRSYHDGHAGEDTAILAGNQNAARAVILHLRACGCRVPEDVAVVSLDGSEFEENAEISTLVVQDAMLGRLAARALLECIESHEPPPSQLLPVDFIRRLSF